jgi:hypothetical protein
MLYKGVIRKENMDFRNVLGQVPAIIHPFQVRLLILS